MNILYLLSVLSITTNVNASTNEFCDTNHTIKRVFSFGNYIDLLSDETLWRYSILSNSFTVKEFKMRNVITAILFNFNPCQQSLSELYCENAANAQNLVILVSKVDNETHYEALRWNNDTEYLDPNDRQLPWNITEFGLLYSDELFWRIPSRTTLTGLTFISDGIRSNILFASTYDENLQRNTIYRREIKSDGIIENDWSPVIFGQRTSMILGLFTLNGRLFVLKEHNQIYSYELTLHSLKFVEKTTIKDLFNCNKTLSVSKNPNTTHVSNKTNTNTTQVLDTNNNVLWIYFIISLLLVIIFIVITVLIFFIIKFKRTTTKVTAMSTPSNTTVASDTTEIETVDSNTGEIIRTKNK